MWRECSINAEEKLGYHPCQARNKGMMNGVNTYPSSMRLNASLRYHPEIIIWRIIFRLKKEQSEVLCVRSPEWEHNRTFLATREESLGVSPLAFTTGGYCGEGCGRKLKAIIFSKLELYLCSLCVCVCELKGEKNNPTIKLHLPRDSKQFCNTCSIYVKD